jgi:putative hydrolase
VYVSQEPFGDIPLFREIQKLLASSEGPVNLEIARQVALAIATQGVPDASLDPRAAASFDTAVHACEGPLSGYTRLPLEEPGRSHAMGVAEWVTSTLDGWRWLFHHMADRLAGELGRLGGEAEANPLQAALGQVGPLLMGMQIGTLVGHLAADSLARYDLPVPRDDDGRLFVVTPTADRVAQEYGFEPGGLTRWLALHEVSRHLIISSVPWVPRYLKGLITEVVEAIEIDVSDLERRLMELQSQGMETLQEGLGPSSMLPVVPTERHRRALGRVTAFLALFEGYATHAAKAVALEIVGDTARIDEGMARREASTSQGRELLEGLLGIAVDRAMEAAGATFCAAITRLRGPLALNRVWEAPDNLPDAEEVKDPFAWMERQGL